MSRAAWVQVALGLALGGLVAAAARLHDFTTLHVGSAWSVLLAAAAACAWAGLTWLVLRPRRDGAEAPHDDHGVLVVHASQTGFATELAARTAHALHQGGVAADLQPMQALTAARLEAASRVLFVLSTTGEGDAPDAAVGFQRTVMQDPALRLDHVRYAVLALGDRDYDDFCAFGRQVDAWLHGQGAQPWFDRVEVDNADEAALRHWQRQLAMVSGAVEQADWSRPAYQSWRLHERRLLNPGSAGLPCFHVALKPDDPAHLAWEAGDIAEVGPRAAPDGQSLPHREYSIASLPADGAMHLVVRQVRLPDGSLGSGSGWLTEGARPGDRIDVRVRANAGFHAPHDDRPCIFVGNGTGIAGLRALLKERLARGHQRNWLVYGERHPASDRLHVDELEAWQRDAGLQLDLVWSRAGGAVRYVQDQLRRRASDLRQWVADGAAIYVCGSLNGMAPGVDAALRDALGHDQVDALAAAGRYRRDVY